MHRLVLSLVIPCGLALAACGAPTSAGTPVPDGVQKQYDVLAEEISEKGKTVTSGDWTVNLITEAAEPWFELHHGDDAKFRKAAAGETNHIEIIPVETATGRIVPDVPITLEVLDGDTVVQKQDLNFYYSTFFHYANNFSIPEPGTYTVRATLQAPGFFRHGSKDETPALAKGAVVEFEDVTLGAQ